MCKSSMDNQSVWYDSSAINFRTLSSSELIDIEKYLNFNSTLKHHDKSYHSGQQTTYHCRRGADDDLRSAFWLI